MTRPLTVLLVEDDAVECLRFENHIDTLDDVRLVATTSHAKKALEHTADHKPDAIILDLELHKGSGDGLSFLRDLRATCMDYAPYVLVTTNNIHSMTHEQARRLGAGFIMVKSQADYSVESVISFLYEVKDIIQGSQQKAIDNAPPPAERKKRLLAKISCELERLGMSPKMIGREYLTEYIWMMVDESQHEQPMVAIGNKFKKTEESVRQAMQNAIYATWRDADIDALTQHYTAPIRSSKGVPTVQELAYYYRDKVR